MKTFSLIHSRMSSSYSVIGSITDDKLVQFFGGGLGSNDCIPSPYAGSGHGNTTQSSTFSNYYPLCFGRMDTLSFVVGLSGVITVTEKALGTWQSLAATRQFGSDLTAITAQLSMEYYRFASWARVSGILGTMGSSGQAPSNTPQSSRNPAQAPIEDAVAQIALILEEILSMSANYKLDQNLGTKARSTATRSGSAPSLALGLSTTLPLGRAHHNPAIISKIIEHKDAETAFNSKVSFRLRFTFASKPWGSANKHALEEKINRLTYWNDRLESLLPNGIRRSLTGQGLSSYMLTDEDKNILKTLTEAAQIDNGGVRAHAQLWKEKLEFSESTVAHPIRIETYRRNQPTLIGLDETQPSRCSISIKMFKESSSQGAAPRSCPSRLSFMYFKLTSCTHELIVPFPVAVEWYSYETLNWDLSNVRLASHRLAELVHLSSMTFCPKSLRILEGLGFLEQKDSLGIIYRLPKNINAASGAVSLQNLLKRVVSDFRPPDLDKRLYLAQQLATSLYSFGLVRWFHKDFNCHNVVFFRDLSSPPRILLEQPFITGFSISRPDLEGQKSLNAELDARSIYLHPDLRVHDAKNRPGYHRKYDVYSLGLVLFEVGVWRAIDKIVDARLQPNEFKEAIVERAKKDLGFYVGPSYRNVVLNCLKCADKDSEDSASSLTTLYWSVVLEIAKLN